jgi:carbonic anhydrase
MSQEVESSNTSAPLGRPSVKVPRPYDFAKANAEYVQQIQDSFGPNLKPHTPGPRSRTAVITCVDSRSTPEHFFELGENEAVTIRNGGGRTNDPGVLRSLAIIQATSELREVKVVHHASKYEPNSCHIGSCDP